MSTASPITQPRLTAQGNIAPSRWITSHATIFQGAIQASDSTAIAQQLIGISEAWTRYNPNSAADDGYIAIAGEALSYRGPGQIALLKISATVPITVPNVLITTNADGKGTPLAPVAGTVTQYGALAIFAAAVDELVPVYILSPFITN